MLDNYSGATGLVPIFGDPIAQVKAPNGLTRAFEARGDDLIVIPVHVSRDDIRQALDSFARFPNVHGMIATVPHKFALFEFAAQASPRASFLGSANVLRPSKDGWYADMLDGQGYVTALEDKGCQVSGRRVLLAGAGGAGSAIAFELLSAGVSHLDIHDVDGERRRALVAKLAARYPERVGEGTRSVVGYDVFVNATTSGMNAGDEMPIEIVGLQPPLFVGDVVTVGIQTPIIQLARERGCGTVTGTDMFNAVARLMLEFFTGVGGKVRI